MTKSNSRKRKLLLLAVYSPSLMEASLRRPHWGRTGAEAMKEHCVLACSQWLAQSVFLSSRTCLPRVGTIHNELSPPTSIINVKKKKMSHKHAQRPVWWRRFLNWGSLFPSDSSLYWADRNQPVLLSVLSLLLTASHAWQVEEFCRCWVLTLRPSPYCQYLLSWDSCAAC